MPLIQWNDALVIGINPIDQQHKHLVQLINDLHDAMIQRRAKEILGEIIEELSRYAQEHFVTEERLFNKHNYPGKDAHQDEHNRFIAQILEFNENFKAGRASLSIEIMNFLNQWLINHIRKADKAYAPFLKDKV